jgi:hypothetical protein
MKKPRRISDFAVVVEIGLFLAWELDKRGFWLDDHFRYVSGRKARSAAERSHALRSNSKSPA